jgi:hypothetical protein
VCPVGMRELCSPSTLTASPPPRDVLGCRGPLSAVRWPRVIPWIIIAVVAVPLVVIAFMAMRRNTAASELPASNDADARARTEQEFADAEAYEAKWHEEDKERFHQERLP